ncbi:hypothetical protein CCP4SC76_4690002 [Gammaproteobacteria bacterium]
MAFFCRAFTAFGRWLKVVALALATTPFTTLGYPLNPRNSGKFEPDWLDSLSVSIIFE